MSSNSLNLQKEEEEPGAANASYDAGMGSIARALKNLVVTKNSQSSKARRHASLPISSVNTESVVAAHILNPSSAALSTSPTSTAAPNFPKSEKLQISKTSREHTKLTENAAARSRDKNTPPLTPRALSHEGQPADKRSPLSTTSNAISSKATEAPAQKPKDTASVEPSREGLPVESPKGKLSVRISEARGLRPSYDPYVVCVFEWNEYISKGPKHDAAHADHEDKKRKAESLASGPMRRTDSDMGKPMAIPMKSRQSSNNSQMDNFDQRNGGQVTDPQWDHEAVLYGKFPPLAEYNLQVDSDVLGHQSDIAVSVYDRSNQETFLGHAKLCLNLKEDNTTIAGWFPLVGRGPGDDHISGEIHLEMKFQKTDKKHFGPNDFSILKLIGKGTFGQVYQVRKKDTLRIYAMKVLSKKVIIQKKEVAHTIGERNILVRTAMADSPFIVGLKFSFQTATDLYLVTDFMSGGELFWHLQKEGRFQETRAKFYIAELILALQHLHDHDIVYRDLKPENILLDANGHIALCDFGLSKANLTKNDTTNTFCGTTEYLAPEVLLDEQGYTKMVDFWSLGVLVFEMCCGWSPFYAEDTQQMYKNIAFGKVRFPRDALSTEGRNFVKGLLNRNPKHRLGATHDAKELMDHAFFNDIDWVALGKKSLIPPFKPKLKSVMDTSNFDPEFTNALENSSSLNARAAALAAGAMTSSTPLSPTMQNAFRGFTFVDESAMDSHFGSQHADRMEEDEKEDYHSLQPSRSREHRMSGVERTGAGDDGIFSNDGNFDI